MKSIITFMIIGFVLTNCEKNKELDASLKKVTIKNCKLSEITIPQGNTKKQTYEYAEGNVQTFTYSDQSFVTVICGSLMNFGIPEDKKGKYWRKEKLNGKTIIYGNVDQR